MEKSSGLKVKTLRSDNGGEFTEYLTKEGIKQERHTPQQNGVAERLNRTLIEGVRTMLADPRKFWAEALSTCVYLRNRSPTKSVGEMTPYEAWNGSKPCSPCVCPKSKDANLIHGGIWFEPEGVSIVRS